MYDMLKNLISLNYRDLSFDGIQLFWSNDKFDWNTNKEMGSYLDGLIEEGSEYSSLRYKSVFKEINALEIHIKISWSFLMKPIALLLLGASAIGFFYGIKIIGGIIFLASFGSWLLSEFFNRRASELYAGYLMTSDLTDLIFAAEKDKEPIDD